MAHLTTHFLGVRKGSSLWIHIKPKQCFYLNDTHLRISVYPSSSWITNPSILTKISRQQERCSTYDVGKAKGAQQLTMLKSALWWSILRCFSHQLASPSETPLRSEPAASGPEDAPKWSSSPWPSVFASKRHKHIPCRFDFSPASAPAYGTRNTSARVQEVQFHLASAELYQQQFLPRYPAMWDSLAQQFRHTTTLGR